MMRKAGPKACMLGSHSLSNGIIAWHGTACLLRLCRLTRSISERKIRLWLPGEMCLPLCPLRLPSPVILVGFLPRVLQVPLAMERVVGASKHLGEDRQWTPVRAARSTVFIGSHDGLHGTQAPGKEETTEWPPCWQRS